jgi:hypothetical protein
MINRDTYQGEFLYLFKVLQDEIGMLSVMFRGELGDVVPLIIVYGGQASRSLGLVPSKVTNLCVREVLQFLFQRELEEISRNGVLVSHVLIGKTVPFHVEEAYWELVCYVEIYSKPASHLNTFPDHYVPFLSMKLKTWSANSCFPPG